MCGIAGYAESGNRDWSHEPFAVEHARAALVRMCAPIRHRGPDDEGIHIGPGVGLGMRRLSIIDVAAGQQPIHNEDRTIWIVFNGEIYNYRELRVRLEAAGHRFYTASDTETIVHAYEQWGEGAFERLRGMFGVAVWDARTGTLLLARDRVGIKPLHYARVGDRLYFGSEIKSILAGEGVEPRLDLASLDHYLSFLYTPREATIFEGIRKLPPGHLLRWRNGALDVRQYWQLPADERPPSTEAAAVEGLREVLREAVGCHLMSEVPLGAFLSGGVDSSIVVGLMSEVTNQPVRTFSIGFDDPQFDELEHARVVARHFGTDHHEFVVRPDALAIIEDLVTHFDEPFGDTSAIPTWYVSELARRYVTVVLSGDGGDELFGGYDRYFPHRWVSRFDRWAPPGTRPVAALVWPVMPHGAPGKNLLRRVSRDRYGRYLDEIAYFHRDEKPDLLTGEVRREIAGLDAEARLQRHFTRFEALPWHAQLMHFDFETYLPEDILTKVDRMSMAHSIESRVPLLDHHVVEFAARMPSDLKIRNGRRKHLLKEAAAGLVPPGILDRAKQGFAVPVSAWFRGGLQELFRDVLLSPRARQRGYFEVRFLERLVREHVSGRRDHSARLWALLMFELWHRQYLDSGSGFAVRSNAVPVSAAS